MSETFLTYKTFTDKETIQDFADVLKQKDISYLIEEDALILDPVFANNELDREYQLLLKPEDFESANQVLAEFYRSQLDKIDKDYYLFSFTDGELREIIEKPDEWGPLDYQLAQKLLSERGITVNPEETQQLRARRIEELARPGTAKRSAIVLGYILCYLILPIGLVMGWIWGFSKKTLPNGERVYRYDSYARKHGRRIFAMGCILVTLGILARILIVLFNINY